MSDVNPTTDREPSRDAIDRMPGAVLLEFGASWCGYCQAAEPAIQALRREYPRVRFLWVEDGRGKPLGRSFRVKLWPTLVFLRDGQVVRRLVRPEAGEVREAFEAVTAATPLPAQTDSP